MKPVTRSAVPDFRRRVHAVLGLPFDAVDEAGAEAVVRRAIAQRRQCFLSTPNLNFAMGCLADAEFRQSVLTSDLSIADGWPIVMASRLVGGGLKDRVAGSGLFERLLGSPQRPALDVFFFGGPPGAAAQAHARLRDGDAGLRSVGFDEAGFGQVEDMSSADVRQRINDSGAGFLVVALGARKGQAWILRNLAQLEIPVVSHLGAVVNFVAGTVVRAPRWVQVLRGEWLWRILQEPALFGRYRDDGLALLRVLARDLLPLAWRRGRRPPASAEPDGATLSVAPAVDELRIVLGGVWTEASADPLREALQRAVEGGRPVAIDLSEASYIDSAVLGLLMLLHGWQWRNGRTWTIAAASPDVERLVLQSQAAYLLRPR